MKVAIIYRSKTGNTKHVAEAIKEEVLNQNNEVIYFGEPQNDIEADLYIIGSWTDKGTGEEKIVDYLKSLDNKKIAYFGTAGFGGSEEYYNSLFNRTILNINSSNEILGKFYCQGKMPIEVRNRYQDMIKAHPNDKNLEANLINFDKALSHPNDDDLINAKKWIKYILNEF